MKQPKKSNREEIIRGVTNDLLTDRFTKDLGSKARVDRTEIVNEHMSQLRGVIEDVGRDLERVGAVPKGMEYVGSLSVHVFKSSVLNTAAFATVSNMGTLDGALADGALRELTGSTMIQFGRARKKLRSNF